MCEECALDLLPALIADAVFIPRERGHDELKRKCREIELRFWRAVALRLESGNR